MHKVFISYHHANDQDFKEALLDMNDQNGIFVDQSVDTGDISDALSDQQIRQKIRDEYLSDTTVTILLSGTQTGRRKHIDWELYSSMFDGTVNKKSGILVINLPTTNCTYYTASHAREKEVVYPETTSWISITNRSEFESRFPHLPARIIDNLLKPEAKVSVTPWEKVYGNPDILSFLIDATYEDRGSCDYNLSRDMRRADS